MSLTRVVQSHTQPLPHAWLATCMQSVKNWAAQNKFDYKFIDDQLFDHVPVNLLEKTKKQPVVATDLARLKILQEILAGEYETAIWCDADFFIFAPKKFKLPAENYALGREVWIQQDKKNNQKLTTHVKVHNAFLMFRRGNPFLNFYTDTAEKLLSRVKGPMPPQFIGPKLLTAIHNIAQCPVLETAGMLSPLVIKDIARQGGPALDLFTRQSPHPIAAANLCHSLYARGDLNDAEIEQCIASLDRFF